MDTPEIQPQAGGSYLRNPDGSLTQTEGPDLAKTAPDSKPAEPINFSIPDNKG